jgi:G3E family GTPase
MGEAGSTLTCPPQERRSSWKDMMSQNTVERVPVTLVAGFLGSGKTTLVNRILSAQHAQRIAVIVNEFGEVGIDGRLVVGVEENVVQLSNGCLCCTVRGDLVTTVHDLLARRREAAEAVPFDRILIEASGLASPGPAVQTLLADRSLAAQCRIDGVITLVNAPYIVRQLQEHPEASAQLGYADHVIVNHCDQCDAETLAAVEGAVLACNPHVTMEKTSHADVAIPALLQMRTWEMVTPRLMPSHAAGSDLQPHIHDGHEHTEPHTCGVSTLTLRMDVPLDLTRLKLWLLFIVKRRSHELMRFKGILRCQNQAAAVIVQGVYQWVELRQGHEAAPAESVLVLIGRHLDAEELRREWADCRARA